MRELYMAELRRFARWAMLLGVLHAVGLLLLDRSFPWMRDDAEIAVVFGFVYAVAGALLGVYQSASYGRTHHWITLLHRPLAPGRILAATSGAAATWSYVAVSIPLLVFTAVVSAQAGRVVDARHWLLALAGGLLALVGMAIGSYLALAPRRYGWTAIVAASVMVITSPASGAAALVLPLLTLGVLALLLLGAFKLDRSSPPATPATLVPTVGVATVSLYFLLIGGTAVAFQLGLTALGRNPETNEPPHGGPVEASRASSKDLLAAAVAVVPGEEGAMLRGQLRRAEAVRLPLAPTRLPTRGELTNSGPVAFTEAGRGIQWTYSHDANALLGLRLMDRRAVGALQPAGAFQAPPLLVGDGAMITGGDLLRLDSRSGRLERALALPAGEIIVAKPAVVGAVGVVLGDKALHLVDRSALEGGRESAPGIVVPLPGKVGDLHRIDMARLGDRTLVSFFFGRDSIDGPAKAWQQLVSVDPDGAVRPIARRSLAPDYPDALRYRAYWLSPALRALVAWRERMGAGSTTSPSRSPVDVPSGVWLAAGLLSVAAAAATAAIARRRRVGRAQSLTWTLAALLLGLPLLAAFWLIRPRPALDSPAA